MKKLTIFFIVGLSAVSVAQAQETKNYTYDALGRLIFVKKTAPSRIDLTSNYVYDKAGNRKRVIVCGSKGVPSEGTIHIGSASTLYVNDALVSPNGKYQLHLQLDGHLVLYNSSRPAIWYNGVSGTHICRMSMQADGNLVVYDNKGAAAWHTSTYGNGPSRLVLQDDGNLVIYRLSDNMVTWHTATTGM
ncbi:hypothetical protein [Alteripontixanthobacter maritimus]|nr:hypothetical protein [Alteripontixanthobacter maritimus]